MRDEKLYISATHSKSSPIRQNNTTSNPFLMSKFLTYLNSVLVQIPDLSEFQDSAQITHSVMPSIEHISDFLPRLVPPYSEVRVICTRHLITTCFI